MAAVRRLLDRAGLAAAPPSELAAFEAADRVRPVALSAGALLAVLAVAALVVDFAAVRLAAGLLAALRVVDVFAAALFAGAEELLAVARDVDFGGAFAAVALLVVLLAAGLAAVEAAAPEVRVLVPPAGAAGAARPDRAVVPVPPRDVPPVAPRAALRKAPTAAPAAPSAALAAARAVLRAAPVADFAVGSFGSFLVPLTTSLKLAPGLNFGTEVFFSLTEAPVAGLRPVRAGLSRFSKEPKPVSTTRSPLATVRVTVSSKASTAVVTVLLSTATRSATASMSSDLFTSCLRMVSRPNTSTAAER